jgi:hypothetical protein
MPPPGSDIAEFLASATLRPPGALLAEDDRTYDLWCRALAARRNDTPLHGDLNWNILYERRHAFEWLDGMQMGRRRLRRMNLNPAVAFALGAEATARTSSLAF